MSTVKFVATSKAPGAVGPYSQATIANNMVFVSGQLGLDPETMELAPDFKSQAEQALNNMKAILEGAGCEIEDIVSVDVFLTHMAEFKNLNELYEAFMGGHKPARAAIEVSALPLGGKVEIKCIAVKK